ncbi:hypothetical protein BCR42DRAFT_402063 [Absidia repens]|uniref:Uncharacterized protein n=1 Tax=Absidia repens TaxID=90262 RepID=A0A1X2IXG9_9FUNG|nr:hypothetical protein BCR42DRAFT_402063 [Absidia repens]
MYTRKLQENETQRYFIGLTLSFTLILAHLFVSPTFASCPNYLFPSSQFILLPFPTLFCHRLKPFYTPSQIQVEPLQIPKLYTELFSPRLSVSLFFL